MNTHNLGNPNAPFICGVSKSLGRPIQENSLLIIYDKYKKEFFPKLLKRLILMCCQKISKRFKELLKKPWNLYIRRHSALTEKSTILKEHTLRQQYIIPSGASKIQYSKIHRREITIRV